jgi:hypothetical protein
MTPRESRRLVLGAGRRASRRPLRGGFAGRGYPVLKKAASPAAVHCWDDQIFCGFVENPFLWRSAQPRAAPERPRRLLYEPRMP